MTTISIIVIIAFILICGMCDILSKELVSRTMFLLFVIILSIILGILISQEDQIQKSQAIDVDRNKTIFKVLELRQDSITIHRNSIIIFK